MNLSTIQRAHFARVRTTRDALREAKLHAKERARAIVEEEVLVYRAALDHEIRLAFNAGVPKMQIGRAMGTTDLATVRASLQRTSGLASTTEAESIPDRFAWANDERTEILVTMYGEDWDAWITAVASNKSFPRFRPEGSFVTRHEESTAILTWDGENVGLTPADFFEKSTQNMIDHPVIGFLKLNGGVDQVTDWARANTRGTSLVEPASTENIEEKEGLNG